MISIISIPQYLKFCSLKIFDIKIVDFFYPILSVDFSQKFFFPELIHRNFLFNLMGILILWYNKFILKLADTIYRGIYIGYKIL